MNNEHIASDIVTQDQLFKRGEDAFGEKLPLPYAPFTVDIKSALGQPTDRITLKNKGDFYAGHGFNDQKWPVEGNNTDSKATEISKEWGDVTNLNDKSIASYNEQTQEELIEEIQKGLIEAIQID